MILISRPQVQAWRRAEALLSISQGEDMLQAMLDAQDELVELLEVPRDLEGIQEAAVGIVKEAAEVIEQVYPGARAWKEVNYEEADKEAIDVLLYLLEYFVLRGFDAEDILGKYYEKVEVVTERQTSKEARDKEEYIAEDEVLGQVKVQRYVEELSQSDPMQAFELIAGTTDADMPFLLEALKAFYE
jgi:hypothetical protein